MPRLGDLSALAGRPFAAVLFDNDGTLVDSTPAVIRSWVAWARDYDIDPHLLGQHHGVPASGIIAQIAPHLSPGEAEVALARITAMELADTDGVVALPGAVDAVAALLPRRCAVVTSATHELGLARLQAAGIPLPDVVVTFDDVEHGKPHPDPFLVAAERLGVAAEECLVVEDAPSGLRAAKAAGCATLALTSTTNVANLDATTDADAIVDSLAAVRFSVTTLRCRSRHLDPAGRRGTAPPRAPVEAVQPEYTRRKLPSSGPGGPRGRGSAAKLPSSGL
ncbi:HAD family hydrolase [Dermacoccus nishinomiyaensis]|uniref:HAD family hydrolase n=1 Tax=Dermacoccus nishinomiyaensis TaxID=1274 RepID=UPI0028A281A4|nr:HAD-IA family hydrolase [Dermacoccus nishinomiyaensis]